ncbi:MAG: hypothetical protein B7Y39_01740 [Bdellovibrio sp. 28-41-41]|nr:MAG: hypothetical protein B7Y39_01740 [Bdellovibrio sp. 28-41-41]
MKATKLVLALVVSAGFSFADTQVAPWLRVGIDATVDTTASKVADYEASLKTNLDLRFEVLMREGIKAVVKARLEQTIVENGKSEDWQKVDIEKLVEEAYIQIETDKISGLPRAIITAGKQTMAFGQALTELPMFRDNLLYNLSAEREMIGLTVTLPTNFLKVVDSVAISMYENGAGDFKVADEKGVSIKVSKALSEQLKLQASALIKENANTTDKETRGSLGFVYTGDQGKYKVWAEGLVFDNNPTMPNTKFGGQIGGSYQLGRGAVVVEYQYLEKQAKELAIAYNLPVNSWLVIAPEVRFRKNENGQPNETRVGIQARIALDKVATKKLKMKN